MYNFVKARLDISGKAAFILAAFFLALAFSLNIQARNFDQFTYLAQAFLQGHLHFVDPSHLTKDAIRINGVYYWQLGPFPSVLLMPLVFLAGLFRFTIYQGYAQFVITCAIMASCYQIARRLRYSESDALLLAFGFCFASVYQFTAFVPWCPFFAHAVTVLLLLLIIGEYLAKKRTWLLGILFAMVFATRFSAGFAVIFLAADIMTDRNIERRKKWGDFLLLFAPIVATGLVLLLYNWVRFGDALENGYRLVSNHSSLSSLVDERAHIRTFGLFQLRNIPSNFYYYFIKTLDPVLMELPWRKISVDPYVLKPPYVKVGYPGTSFFVTSPIFLYAFRTRLKEKTAALALLAVVTVLLVTLSYYWTGAYQMGPRYSQDFLPFAFLLLLFSFPGYRLTGVARGVIIASALFNLFLFYPMWKSFRLNF